MEFDKPLKVAQNKYRMIRNSFDLRNSFQLSFSINTLILQKYHQVVQLLIFFKKTFPVY